jgi:hypothetical protein
LEKRDEVKASDVDTRVGELENRIVDLAEAREKLLREEGSESDDDLLKRMVELEAKLDALPASEGGSEALEARLDEVEAGLREQGEAEPSERLEAIEKRLTSLSDDQQLAAAKMGTKVEASASRFGELEWRFGEILEKFEAMTEKQQEISTRVEELVGKAEEASSAHSDGGNAEVERLEKRLEQLEVELKNVEENRASQGLDPGDNKVAFDEHRQMIERNERVLRALAVKVARMTGETTEE